MKDDFIRDLKLFLYEFLLKKALDAIVRSTVVFYIRCLLLKAQKQKHHKKAGRYFNDNEVALRRMAKDVELMRDFFDALAEDDPALNRIIESEFFILVTIMELLQIAASGLANVEAASSCTGYIVVLHKRIKFYKVTKLVVRDLWSIMYPDQEKIVKKLVESLKGPLTSMYPGMEDLSLQIQERSAIPGMQFDASISQIYVGYKSKKKRRWLG